MALDTTIGGVAANSYVDLVYARAYATSRGFTLSVVDATAETYLLNAMDYLESLRSQYIGEKATTTQALQWPRTGAYIDGVEFASDALPNELKNAQVRLALAVQDGLNLMPTSTGAAFVTKEKVGPIETQYSESVGNTSGIPIVRVADAFLAVLLIGGDALTTVRA